MDEMKKNLPQNKGKFSPPLSYNAGRGEGDKRIIIIMWRGSDVTRGGGVIRCGVTRRGGVTRGDKVTYCVE